MPVRPETTPRRSGSVLMAKKAGLKKRVQKPANEPDVKGPAPESRPRSQYGESAPSVTQSASTHVDILHFKMDGIHDLSWNQVLKVITLTAAIAGIFVGAISALLYELHLAYPSGPPWQVLVGAFTAVLGVSAWGIARDILNARTAPVTAEPQKPKNTSGDSGDTELGAHLEAPK
jgi:xanthosine utilization system XapX-like protein